MSITIRPARPGEAALVLAFVQELADYERLSHEVVATQAMIDAALFGPHPNTFCEFAERNGEPVGFALWFFNFSSFRGRNGIYLEDVYVRPAHRGSGVGRAILRHLAARCVAEGLARFEWSVLDWNETAIRFYEAQGAQLMREWTICRLSGEALERLATAD
jgi:GNAT superfamily N-acetyltransferase